MDTFVKSILDIIYIFSWNDCVSFIQTLNVVGDLTLTDYILFNLGFWLVLAVYFNFIYRLSKFTYNAFFC